MDFSSIDLKAFIEAYVNSAFESLIINELKPLSDFEERVWNDVSKRFDISIETIKYLHHPFHWAFFCVNKKTPFEYIRARLLHEVTSVKLKLDNDKTRKEMIDYIVENDYKLLEARFENLKKTGLHNLI